MQTPPSQLPSLLLKLPKQATLLGLFLVLTSYAQAYDLRWGGTIGYGGAGVSEKVGEGSTKTTAQKSEGPGVASFFVENLVSDDFMVGLEHSFGFRFGPFSAGVNFTGLLMKWYFWGPAIFRVDEGASADNSTFFVNRYAPFYGFNTGVATAHVTRQNDVVDSISASGVYIGGRVGVDHSVQKDVSYRYEIISNTTFFSTAPDPPKLTEFALSFGVFFFFK